MGNFRDPDPYHHLHLRSSSTGTADRNTVRYTCRLRIRRSHIPDLRHDDPGVYWCTVQPPETRWNSGTICLHRSRMLPDRIYHRRLYRQTGTGCLHSYHAAVCTGSALYRAYHHAQDRRSCKISEQSCTGINRSQQNDKTITNHITKTRSENIHYSKDAPERVFFYAKPAPQAVYCFTVIPPSRHRCKKPYRHEKNEQCHYIFLR